MILSSPAEIAFYVFSIPVRYYGLILASAMVLGIVFSVFICKKFFPELDSEEIYNVSPYIIIASIIGARLYYCILSHDYYFRNPSEILQIWQGGLSLHGGIIGGALVGLIYAKKHALNTAKYCDVFSFGILLGQIIGRWGNFFNSEAFGIPCNPDYFLKLYIPITHRPLEYMQYEYFHPAFLYEILLNTVILFILVMMLKYKTRLKSGTFFCAYLIMYSLARIITEQIRIDSINYIAGLPAAQFVSIVVIILSTVYLIKSKNYSSEA